MTERKDNTTEENETLWLIFKEFACKFMNQLTYGNTAKPVKTIHLSLADLNLTIVDDTTSAKAVVNLRLLNKHEMTTGFTITSVIGDLDMFGKYIEANLEKRVVTRNEHSVILTWNVLDNPGGIKIVIYNRHFTVNLQSLTESQKVEYYRKTCDDLDTKLNDMLETYSVTYDSTYTKIDELSESSLFKSYDPVSVRRTLGPLVRKTDGKMCTIEEAVDEYNSHAKHTEGRLWETLNAITNGDPATCPYKQVEAWKKLSKCYEHDNIAVISDNIYVELNRIIPHITIHSHYATIDNFMGLFHGLNPNKMTEVPGFIEYMFGKLHLTTIESLSASVVDFYFESDKLFSITLAGKGVSMSMLYKLRVVNGSIMLIFDQCLLETAGKLPAAKKEDGKDKKAPRGGGGGRGPKKSEKPKDEVKEAEPAYKEGVYVFHTYEEYLDFCNGSGLAYKYIKAIGEVDDLDYTINTRIICIGKIKYGNKSGILKFTPTTITELGKHEIVLQREYFGYDSSVDVDDDDDE